MKPSAPDACCPMVISAGLWWAAARGKGVGSALLTALMEEARRRGHAYAVLSAQTHAREFYRRHGYSVHGDEYDDAGIPHVEMRCPL